MLDRAIRSLSGAGSASGWIRLTGTVNTWRPPRTEDTVNLLEAPPWIGDMLEYILTDDEVELLVRIRQVLHILAEDTLAAVLPAGNILEVVGIH